MVATDLALALPDQDQADRAERRAVAGPLDLLDHEARLRQVDYTGALTDPEQPHGEREEANDQKQFTHRIFLDRAGPARPIAQGWPEWRARSPRARAGIEGRDRGQGLSFRAENVSIREATKKPRTMPGLLSCCSKDQYFATSGPVQLKR